MPYEAAKAIAATFCWSIRYALTPVFGRDFPSTCIPPNSDRFGDMVIDAAITRRCAEEAKEYRLLENRQSARAVSATPSPITPTHPHHIKQLRPKALKVNSQSSGYSTDASNDEAYSLSSRTPNTAYRNVWTPANTPRSTVHFDSLLPSPREIHACISTGTEKRSNITSASTSNSSSPVLSPKSRRRFDAVDDFDGDNYGETSLTGAGKLPCTRESQHRAGHQRSKASSFRADGDIGRKLVMTGLGLIFDIPSA
jgi:hypothetical protein